MDGWIHNEAVDILGLSVLSEDGPAGGGVAWGEGEIHPPLELTANS